MGTSRNWIGNRPSRMIPEMSKNKDRPNRMMSGVNRTEKRADSGSYSLVIHLPRPVSLAVGALGTFEFKKGFYIYTGRAKRNLRARIERHLRSEKRLHWHIDYLLNEESARVTDVVVRPGLERSECAKNRQIASLPGAETCVPGFGASDCANGCGAHLVFFERRPSFRSLG